MVRSESWLDLQAMRSARFVSRLLTGFLKILLGIFHTVGFSRLHFPVQVEIGGTFLETLEYRAPEKCF